MSLRRKSELIVGEQNAVEITRVFDFPRDSVFSMWTDPRQVAKWWGPEGCLTVVCEVDPRPGGAMRIDVRTPEGTIYPMSGSFEKIVVPELIIFRSAASGGDDAAPWETLNTVTFEELSPKRTRVTVLVNVVAAGSWPGDLDSLKKGFKGGWAQSFDKLQRALR
jgi:uncharacterized protein YndB with AHSA1/START domain